MILISKCYEVWDEDALECGETDDKGYEFEDVAYTFKELVFAIKSDGFTNTSDYPTTENSWLYTDMDVDYRTGEETTYSLHFSHNNPEKNRKYWKAALKAAGLMK